MFADKIGESCSTAGTATFSLAGAYGAFRTWRSGFATAEIVFYLATKDDATIWEVGYGTLTYGSPDTLSRDAVIASSSGGSKISWSGTYRIYSVPIGLAMKLMQSPMINGVANVPAWIPQGFSWIDYSLGISTEWVENLYVSGTRTTATSHVEKARYKIGLAGGEPNIHVPSMRQKWTDVGAANKTIAADDVDGMFTFDTSAAGRTLTLPDVTTTGIGHGFTVGALGKSQSFPVTVTPNASQSIEAGTNGASRTVAGGALFLMKWDGANSTWRIIVWALSPSGLPGVVPFSDRRHTVMGGPVDSNSFPNFLATVSGLALSTSNVSTSAPLVVTAANGFGFQGRVDRFGISTANISFGTLTNTTTNYLYVDIDILGGLTGGFTTTAPIDASGGAYSITNGQYTFNHTEMIAKLGNGSVANQVWRVFVGEADTSGGNVTAVRAYAYNGRAESVFVNTLPSLNTTTNFDHNLGVNPRFKIMLIECITTDLGYAVGDQVDTLSGLGSATSIWYMTPLITVSRNRVAVVAVNSTPWDLGNKSPASGPTGPTAANWKYKFIADRGW